MACECITEMDALLAERNTRLCQTIIFSKPGRCTVTLNVEKVDRKKRDHVSMIPTFCPFCGVRYVPEPPTPVAEPTP